MRTSPAPRLAALPATLLPLLAQAHEGHGLGGSHWHATDSFGWLLALALVAIGLWFTRK